MTKINGYFYLRNAMLSVALLSIVFLAGCTPPPTGGGQPPSELTVSIQNPQWGMGQGTPINWLQGNDADHVVKVKVQTLDANNNATLYKAYSWTYNYTGLSEAWHNKVVEVPRTGMYVIQVEILFSECTWQFSTCSLPARASTKEYFTQQTFNSRPGLIQMPVSNSNLINQNCIC